jgi:hypothetical protein
MAQGSGLITLGFDQGLGHGQNFGAGGLFLDLAHVDLSFE